MISRIDKKFRPTSSPNRAQKLQGIWPWYFAGNTKATQRANKRKMSTVHSVVMRAQAGRTKDGGSHANGMKTIAKKGGYVNGPIRSSGLLRGL